MRQFYIRKTRHTANGNVPASSNCVIGHICANCTILVCVLLHSAEFSFSVKNLILIGTDRSYLTVILPNMDLGTGGECG